MRKKCVLVLCTGNSARSQMAEALIRKHGGEIIDVYSAGTEPAAQINPFTYRVMSEVGESLEGHSAKGLKGYLGRLPVHTLIIVCEGASKACPSVWPGVRERLFWPFEDPAAVEGNDEMKLEKFRHVRDQIDRKVRVWIETQR